MTDRRPILFVHSSDEMYGADRMLLEVLAALPDTDRARSVVWLPTDVPHGAQPLCAVLAERGIAFEHVDLPVLRRRLLTPGGLLTLWRRRSRLRSRLAATRPEIVVLTTSAGLLAATLVPRGRARVILYLQELWSGREASVLGLLSRRVDRVVAISTASAASLPQRLRRRCVVVTNATADPGESVPIDPTPRPLNFLVASRWNAWKGHDVLLRAWALAGQPGRLVVGAGPPEVGTAVDVPGLVEELGIGDTVELVGEVSDLEVKYQQADVIVLPSIQPEPFGLVVIEAFAHGRPVVATAAGGPLETVRDGAGWLVPPGDPAALAAVLSGLDPVTVGAAGRRARERFLAEYTTERFAQNMRVAVMGVGPHDPTRGPDS